MDENIKPVFQTERFDVYRFRCEHRTLDGAQSDVYLAFFRYLVTTHPICTVTVDRMMAEKFHVVHWIEVTGEFRRDGLATEVFLGLQEAIGPLFMTGLTQSGRAFIASLGDRLQFPKELNFSAEQGEKIGRELRKAMDEARSKGKPVNPDDLLEQLSGEFLEQMKELQRPRGSDTATN